MGIYTIPGQMAKGSDTFLEKVEHYGQKAKRFNDAISPIIGTAQTIFGLGSAATSGIGSVMDSSRLKGVAQALSSINNHVGYLNSEPENFSQNDLNTVNSNLSRVENFIKAYDNQESAIPQETIQRIKDYHNDYSEIFSPDNFEYRRQSIINNNAQEAINEAITKQAVNDSIQNSIQDTSKKHNLFYKFKKLAQQGLGLARKANRKATRLVEEYQDIRNENTKSGISRSAKIVKEMTELAKRDLIY